MQQEFYKIQAEHQREAMDQLKQTNKGGATRPRRGAAQHAIELVKELGKKASNYDMSGVDQQEKRVKKKKDTSIRLVKVYEHQFYDDFGEMQQLCSQVKELQDSYETIPGSLRDKYLA